MTRAAIIVSGSRDWDDPTVILDRISRYNPGTLVFHGDCRGADMLAKSAAVECGLTPIPVPYFGWLGKEGGPARNRAMVEMLLALEGDGYDIAVEAFPLPQSRGTRQLIAYARERGLPVQVTEGS